MKKNIVIAGLLFAATGLFTLNSCSKDPEVTPELEQEEFNSARIDFIRLDGSGSATTDTVTVNFDKEGNATPAEALLKNGTTYRTMLTLALDGTSINNEITEEGTEHKFFFNPSVPGIIDYTYNDEDADGHGIGLDGNMTLKASGTLNLKVVLRHALDKSSPDAQNWNSTTYEKAGGEDDLNISFGLKSE